MTTETARRLEQLKYALERLREALAQPVTAPLVIDGTIQRFEFTFELMWKTMKHLLAAEGINAGTARDTLKEAYAAGWINDQAAWLKMLDDRNDSSHAYSEALAARIYADIKAHFRARTGVHRSRAEISVAPTAEDLRNPIQRGPILISPRSDKMSIDHRS